MSKRNSQTSVKTQIPDPKVSIDECIGGIFQCIMRYRDFEVMYKNSRSLAFQQKEISHGHKKDGVYSVEHVSLRNIPTKKLEALGSRKMAFDDWLEELRSIENRVYQWILVEAYEIFLHFLRQIYAWQGQRNKGSWTKIQQEKLNKNKSFSEVAAQIPLKELLIGMERNLPHAFKQTINGKGEIVNLRLAVTMISELRHIVVHRRGIGTNSQDFIARIFKDTGIRESKKHTQLLNQFLSEHGDFFDIVLHPIILEKINPSISVLHNSFEEIMQYLFSYMKTIELNLN